MRGRREGERKSEEEEERGRVKWRREGAQERESKGEEGRSKGRAREGSVCVW